MTRRYVLSPLAQEDIDGIVDYTATRWGFDQAAIYLKQIRQHIEAVAAFPKSGRPCPQVGPAFYRTKTGSHVVVYRVTDDGIDVARVLHESMDLPRHF